jgi:hypothetical protein
LCYRLGASASRRKMIRGFRSKAFSAMSSVLVRARSGIGSHEERAARWFRPLHDTLMDPTERALESALERSEHSNHSSSGSFKKMSGVRPAGKLMCMDFTVMTSAMASRCLSQMSIAGPKC